MIDAQIQSFISRLGKEQKVLLLEFLKRMFDKSERASSPSNLKPNRLQAYGSLKGKIEMKSNFDEPIEDFYKPL